MGIGDDIIATGLARDAIRKRGRRIAFGDGLKIKWGPYSKMVFKNNPNIAHPGEERSNDIEWIHYYKGSRIYNSTGRDRWNWNYEFRVRPGEFFLDDDEEFKDTPDNLILIEPHVPDKQCGPNKQWGNWHRLIPQLHHMGFSVRQFDYGKSLVSPLIAPGVKTKTIRHAAGLMKKALFCLLPEGGLHHAAAAVGCPAIVLFGGFTPPAVLGYDSHINLTGGAEACGSFTRCNHCIEAMSKISIEEVVSSCERLVECR